VVPSGARERPDGSILDGVSVHDREKWDARYREGDSPSAPSSFLTGLDALLPRRGRALDVAGGAGRHALWLARRGLTVTLTDVSPVALEQASRAAREEGLPLATLLVDLEVEPLPDGPWDLVLCTYFLHRPLFAAFPRVLAPGGWLAFAHATRRNLERHPRPGPAHLLDEGEAATLVRGLQVIQLAEGWFEEGRHEARLLARRVELPIGSELAQGSSRAHSSPLG
jgi:SAM-dependent methyltransferase